jgi:carnosine N-methyltransferase
MDKVRSTIRQCARDWSSEGFAEREQCYGPILNELKERFPVFEERFVGGSHTVCTVC